MAGRLSEVLLVAAIAVALAFYCSSHWQPMCLVAILGACVMLANALWMKGAAWWKPKHCPAGCRYGDIIVHSKVGSTETRDRSLLKTSCTTNSDFSKSNTGLTMDSLAKRLQKHTQPSQRAKAVSEDLSGSSHHLCDDLRSDIMPRMNRHAPSHEDYAILKHRTLMYRTAKSLLERPRFPSSAHAPTQYLGRRVCERPSPLAGLLRQNLYNDAGTKCSAAGSDEMEIPQQRKRFGSNHEEPDALNNMGAEDDSDIMSEISSDCVRTVIGFTPAFLPTSTPTSPKRTPSTSVGWSKSMDILDVMDDVSETSDRVRSDVGLSSARLPAEIRGRDAASKISRPSAIAASRQPQEPNSPIMVLTLDMLAQHQSQFNKRTQN